MKALKAIGLCMLLCLAIAVPASADELVTNGNFQTGNLTGWTGPTGNGGFSSVSCGNDPTAGNCFYSNGAVGSIGYISQNLSTVGGSSYNLSFDLTNLSGSPTNRFEVWWNGNLVYSLFNSSAFPWTSFAISNLIATGGSTQLQFGFQHDPSFWHFDNASVSTNETPEPTTLALLGTGLVGAALRRRKLKA
jgi:hypothetical protein